MASRLVVWPCILLAMTLFLFVTLALFAVATLNEVEMYLNDWAKRPSNQKDGD
jgi:hypothetical protein